MKRCSRCKVSKELSEFTRNRAQPDGYEYYCRECKHIKGREYRERNRARIREYNRLYFLRNPEVRQRGRDQQTPEQRSAWNLLNRAVARGEVIRPDQCPRCDAERMVCAHHEDYGRPWDVEWLCPRCHARHHSEQREAA